MITFTRLHFPWSPHKAKPRAAGAWFELIGASAYECQNFSPVVPVLRNLGLARLGTLKDGEGAV